MNYKLILIEGLPGAGKSTTAQFIWIQMLKSTIAADFISEGQADHPVETDYDDNNTDIKKYIRESLEKWKVFIDNLINSEKICILESSFLQNPLNCMITGAADIEVIREYIDSIQDIIKRAKPLLIYLEQKKIKDAVRKACELKGENWTRNVTQGIGSNDFCKRRGLTGMEALEKFMDYRNELEHQLLPCLTFDKYVIDVTERNWERDRKNIIAYLELEHKAIFPEGYEVDESLVGTYDNIDIKRPFTIYSKNKRLMIFNEMLIPKERDVYYLQGLPVELIIHRDSDGNAVSIEVGGTHIGFFFPLGTVFERCK